MQLILFLCLLVLANAQQSGVHLTVLPSESPMITTSDSWRCATKDIRAYFEPPMPTGDLFSAILDYGDKIQTCTLSGAEVFNCPYPEKSLWCSFSTAAPTTLLDEYIAYGSTASSWWEARSSAAISIARECPHSWWAAGNRLVAGANRLNFTIIQAECYAEAQTTSLSAGSTPSTTTSCTQNFGPISTIPPVYNYSGSKHVTP
jgi:hypothetical protein